MQKIFTQGWKRKGEKKIDKEDMKNCLQPETVSALCIIAGVEAYSNSNKKMFTSQTQKLHEEYRNFGVLGEQ